MSRLCVIDSSILDTDDCSCKVCSKKINIIVDSLCNHFFSESKMNVHLRMGWRKKYFSRNLRGTFGFFCDGIDNLFLEIIESMAIVMFENDITYKSIKDSSLERYGFGNVFKYWEKQDSLSVLDQLVYLHDMTPYVIFDAVKICFGAYQYGILNDTNNMDKYTTIGSKFGIEACVLKVFLQQVLNNDIGSVSCREDLYRYFFNRDIGRYDDRDGRCHFFSVNGNPNNAHLMEKYRDCSGDFSLSIDRTRFDFDETMKEIIYDEPFYVAIIDYRKFICSRIDLVPSSVGVVFEDGEKKILTPPVIPVCVCEKTICDDNIQILVNTVLECESEDKLTDSIIEHHMSGCDKCVVNEGISGKIKKIKKLTYLPLIGSRITFRSFKRFVKVFCGYYSGAIEPVLTYNGYDFGYWLLDRYFIGFNSKYMSEVVCEEDVVRSVIPREKELEIDKNNTTKNCSNMACLKLNSSTRRRKRKKRKTSIVEVKSSKFLGSI